MKEIDSHQQEYLNKLAEYESIALSENLFTLLRSMEELNCLTGEWDNLFEFTILPFNQDQSALKEACDTMNQRFAPGIGDRFKTFAGMCAATNKPELDSVGNTMNYFDTRRALLVATLQLIPHICKGEKKVQFTEMLNEMLPLIETNLAGLSSSYFSLMKREANAGTNNHDHLEYLFADPIMMSLFDQAKFGEQERPEMEFQEMPQGQLHSYVQLYNFLSQFGVASDIYTELRYLVKTLKNYCKDDYTIIVPASAFEALIKDLIHIKPFLFLSDINYYNAVHSIAPFVMMNGNVRTSVTLLSAFINQIKAKAASRSKVFQAESGANFEKMVSEILEENGFNITAIKRINRKEFTLITKNHDFFCKDNITDFVRVNNDYKKLARLNRLRIIHYEKEVDNNNFVISRYPVISSLSGIVNFDELNDYLATVTK
jgi:hypothetical protein